MPRKYSNLVRVDSGFAQLNHLHEFEAAKSEGQAKVGNQASREPCPALPCPLLPGFAKTFSGDFRLGGTSMFLFSTRQLSDRSPVVQNRVNYLVGKIICMRYETRPSWFNARCSMSRPVRLTVCKTKYSFQKRNLFKLLKT